ncbi:hypothetical protein GCM10025867_45190 [Frondihabitans sucicola]|uniref:Alpha-galactosidase n=1 Tax=Frondihabitans sucicola TaxID=1268041 RepID=A0ABM8GUW7_9MICO|nr:glycoside hydrolase family 36 protein [Frondihabitans sucicola]BDZ52278.1 hypothetical protein GCM10025867_45190 [Frondihabitans sucicola]
MRHSHGTRHRNYAATSRLRLVERVADARRLSVTQRDPETGLVVVTTIESTTPTTVAIASHVTNEGAGPVAVEYLSSLVLGGFAEAVEADVFRRLRVHTCLMAWTAEYRWRDESLADVGLVDAGIPHPTSSTRTSYSFGALGSWSTGTHFPQGAVQDRESRQLWMWQLEHNGPWNAELDDVGRDVALSLSGPTFRQHHWSQQLLPGESFSSVRAVVAPVVGDVDDGIAALTGHRRAARAAGAVELPVIANDYMNCLMGDPSTEALLPIIERAAAVGARIFVVDAGWYADDAGWWSTVGEWRESRARFPNGLVEVTRRIRDLGMIPGLWLEPEVMGVDSSALGDLPDEAFFRRAGRPVAEQGRYHLDFRHPAVRSRLDAVVDRLVAEHGIGYFKLDYNVNIGEGTDVDASSLGAGLIGHERAYLAWLEAVRERHPGLLLENCASGGMRADPAQLGVTDLQSTSDQEDPVLNAMIACAAPSVIVPEQAAVWSYPQPHYSDDLNDFTMIQSVLTRVHLGGRLDLLSPAQLARVKAALSVHASLESFIPAAVPFWPLGLPGWQDEWLALGLRSGQRSVVAVFRRGGTATVLLPLEGRATILHPIDRGARVSEEPNGLAVTVPATPGAVVLDLIG